MKSGNETTLCERPFYHYLENLSVTEMDYNVLAIIVQCFHEQNIINKRLKKLNMWKVSKIKLVHILYVFALNNVGVVCFP